MGVTCSQHSPSSIIEISNPGNGDGTIQNDQSNLASQKVSSQVTVKTEEFSFQKCRSCDKDIKSSFIETNCKKSCYYHPVCMENHLKKLIESEKMIIKCQCGTKINTNFLRKSSFPGKMNLLSQLFQRQLDLILTSTKKIRRDEEVQKYVKEHRLAIELHDYILINQNLLIYEETPQ